MKSSLIDLDILLGHWDATFEFPKDPPGKVTGQVAFERFADGAFLVMHSWPTEGGPPVSVGVIGFDEASGDYTMLYHDERGVSRVYAMKFENGVWTMEGRPMDFWQRFRANVNSSEIRGAWERSDDGCNWIHDFAVAYRKRGQYP